MHSKIACQDLRKKFCKNAKKIVIKVGSSVITQKEGLNLKRIDALAGQIAQIVQQKKEVLLVSSGAIAAGMKKMGLKKRPLSLPKQQALAAIGQGELIRIYEEAFANYNQRIAQVLLTRDGLIDRRRYLNARNTLFSLLHWKIIPIINENDTVAVEEIQFGDNDNLAALIAAMVEADLLILLTDAEGLYDADPRINPSAKCIKLIEEFDENIKALAQASPNQLGRGGIGSKIKVAKEMTGLGIPVIIASGLKDEVITQILSGAEIGTFFVPRKIRRLKKYWLASLPPKGILILDAGAAEALLTKGKSLLPSGIVRVEGQFWAGDPVLCMDESGKKLAIGLTNYSSQEINQIKGLKTTEIKQKLLFKGYEEVIHRNNLCLL